MKQTKKTQSDKQKSHAMLWFWIPVAIVGFAAVSGVFLCSYTPRAYQPVQAANTDEVSPYLTHQLGPDFFNQVQLDDPFLLEVKQSGLNDITSRWEWPQQFGDLSFADPMIMFGDGSIYLMGTLKYKKIKSVVTIIALPYMDANQKVCLNIQSVRLGILPITSLAGKIAKIALADSDYMFEGEPDELEHIVRGIVYNEPFEPVFAINDYKARIQEMSIEPGVLKLLFQPE
ncbi:MAG: hypothetical protein ACYTET_04045 [Planctomycetota bacterium]|jgi:hypothetical protein